LIYQGKVVDRATSDAILELLALPETVYFRRGLPPGVRFAGESGASPGMRCEEGIVLLPARPYVFCVMLESTKTRVSTNHERSSIDDTLAALWQLSLDYFSEGRAGGRTRR
jgi:hypothetical protein